MRHQLTYLFISTGLLSVMVLVKLWVVPFALWKLFPQTDLISRLYEVIIMGFGGVTFLMYIVLGYIGKHVFHIRYLGHLFLYFILQSPFALHIFFRQIMEKQTVGFMAIFADGWCGLIAEPTRLMFMVYPWTDAFAIITSFIFLSIGRKIEIKDEQIHNHRMGNQIKVGKI
ncbi:MAG TPA: hypothetical protein VJ824_02400 [Bacillota bacterium]|nr:hypothetical protein [Bacillota bacterium]